MEIRIHGTKKECEQAVAQLEAVFVFASVSDFYPDRGKADQGRIYVDVKVLGASYHPEMPVTNSYARDRKRKRARGGR